MNSESTTTIPSATNTTATSSTSGRVRTSFDTEFELPKLHRWFAENPHPSRLTLQLYVKELNSLASRQSRKLLEVHNLCYWFKNARAAYKRAELRMKKNNGTSSSEQNHHLHHHHLRNQTRPRTSPMYHQQQTSPSKHNSPNLNQDNDHHNQKHNQQQIQQHQIQCQLQNAVSFINQHHFQMLANQQKHLALTNCNPEPTNLPIESGGDNNMTRNATSERVSPIFISELSQQGQSPAPTSPSATSKATSGPVTLSMSSSSSSSSPPTTTAIASVCTATACCESNQLVHQAMVAPPNMSPTNNVMQFGAPINMATTMTLGNQANLQASSHQHSAPGSLMNTSGGQLAKSNSYPKMDIATALDCILYRAKNYTAAAAAAAVVASATNSMHSPIQVAENHHATAAGAATSFRMSSSTGQFLNQNLLHVAAAAAAAAGVGSSTSSLSSSIYTNPMSSPIQFQQQQQQQQQQSLSCPNSFLLGRGANPDANAGLAALASRQKPSQSTSSGLDHLSRLPNLLEHHQQQQLQHLHQHQQQPASSTRQLFTTFKPLNYPFALGMLDDKQLDSNVLNSMAFPTSAHPQPNSSRHNNAFQ